ncbi:MAG: hypothetical protein FWB77_02585 [Treponema sp.]|nr:hypothetical protein [Treponema sp.]
MKRFLIFVIALSLLAGVAAAQEEDDGIGFTVGLEFGILDVNDSEGMYPYLFPSIVYENSFFDGMLDLSAGLSYELGLTKDGDKLPMYLYLDFMAGFNISLSDTSTLSIIVSDENTIDLYSGGDDIFSGTLFPGVCFNYSSDAGDIYFQANIPFAYPDSLVGLDIIAGWGTSFGLGIEASAHILFNSLYSGDNGFTGLGLSFTYEFDPVTAELGITIPFKNYTPYSFFDSDNGAGVAIIPGISVTLFDGFDIYANCTFAGIGVTGGDVGISFAIGISYSF